MTQSLELELGDGAERVQGGYHLPHRAAGVELLAPGSRRYQEAAFGLCSQQVVDELERLDVAPLEVLGDEQERRGSGSGGASPGTSESSSGSSRASSLSWGCEPANAGCDRLASKPGNQGAVGHRPLGRIGA